MELYILTASYLKGLLSPTFHRRRLLAYEKGSSIGLLLFPSLNLDLPFAKLYFVMPLLSDIVGNLYNYPPVVSGALALLLNLTCHAQKMFSINQTQLNLRYYSKPVY